jgi:protein PhnA
MKPRSGIGWGFFFQFILPLCGQIIKSMEVRDSNGNLLKDGDNVTLIKDLKVRGTSTTLKRGTVVKGIKLTEDADEVDCRIDRVQMVLRTEFLKKS